MQETAFFFFFEAQTVKRLPTMWQTGVQFLGQEDPLEKKMAIHSSTLAWKIPWTKEPGELQSKELDTIGRMHTHTHTHTQNIYIT